MIFPPLSSFLFWRQACIKPQPEGRSEKEKVQISLADCLACSGCVTSAETVLINQQSHEEFISFLESPGRTGMGVIVSLSHQAIASFAAKYHLSFQETAERLSGLFKKTLGVDLVYDLTAARTLSILESAREFSAAWSKKDRRFPILNSVCPGWVCYIEKTHGPLVSYLSQVKSPQQIMGSLVKNKLISSIDSEWSSLYHLTVMPCFDKKLEASREYFVDTKTGSRDVDCVLTPIEIEQLLLMKNVTFDQLPRSSVDSFSSGNTPSGNITSHSGSGSGGYAENVLKIAAVELFTTEVESLNYSVRRNKDFLEVDVIAPGQEIPFKFAVVNGFRNIQTLVQMIKRNKCPYHYVEVMACPGGCLNGGAQLKDDQTLPSSLLDSAMSIYSSLEATSLPGSLNDDTLSAFYPRAIQADTQGLLHTQFKEVPKTSNLLTLKW